LVQRPVLSDFVLTPLWLHLARQLRWRFLIGWGQMTTRQTVARLIERIYALVATGVQVDVVVWRHPGETADEAIERYRRQHPIIATMPTATPAFHVVSWED
jgi:hypothetical protein